MGKEGKYDLKLAEVPSFHDNEEDDEEDEEPGNTNGNYDNSMQTNRCEVREPVILSDLLRSYPSHNIAVLQTAPVFQFRG